jgi:rhodanese-related sulfurtransferase
VFQIASCTAAALQSRLMEDQTTMTILDIRSQQTFDREHITKAISMSVDRLTDLARSSLYKQRDIYIYGDSDQQSLVAVKTLRDIGFTSVYQIIGGLPAWLKVAGGTEGTDKELRQHPGI